MNYSTEEGYHATQRQGENIMKVKLLCMWCLAILALGPGQLLASEEPASDSAQYKTYGAVEAIKVARVPERWITTDHSKHDALKGEFTRPEEVTAACLSCHNEAAQQIHETIHWTWLCPADPNQEMGKYGLSFNNFCISVPSNEPRCTSCHAGYGFKDKNFDFSDLTAVDCLVCHDTTGDYKKFPSGAGYPVEEPKKFGKQEFFPPDYNLVAQKVGRPSRDNCGVCHFYGGGGDGVKHGDLDSSLSSPSRDLDVHMNAEGQNFRCVRCHTTNAHKIAGRCYKQPAFDDPDKSLLHDDMIHRISCASCHTDKPHEPGHKANDHTDIVACQTCHIPEFARVLPTKMWWDWSKAGAMKDGKPYSVEGPLHRHSYTSKKGEFRWEKNVQPEYAWFNGTLEYLLLTDKVDPSKGPVQVNHPVGSMDDPRSRIYPFKVHRGKQPFDPVNQTFLAPHLFGKDQDAYWKNFDWKKASQHGMDYLGLPFSGEVDFAETTYYFQITHMVAPKEKSVKCGECHARDGRLANLAGFYMPGRDSMQALDIFGWLLFFGSLAGVLGHGFLRIFSHNKRKG